MGGAARKVKVRRWIGVATLALGGCAMPEVCLPAGHFPAPPAPADRYSAQVLNSVPPTGTARTPAEGKAVAELPRTLPGATAPPIGTLRFAPTATAAERDQATRDAYPVLKPVAATLPPTADGPVTLAQFQELALANSPVIRQAKADSEAALGHVIQAGLHPNPTVGYQADQVQPGLRVPPGSTASGAGQQGGFINQLIKTAGKLALAQQVAGFDYVNALVDVRKSEVAVAAAVRAHFFAALVARESLEINTGLADVADETYRLQLKQVAAGHAAGYEPLQAYAQAALARNGVAQAEAAYRAAWKQLAAAVGQPNLPATALAGRADGSAPTLDAEAIKVRILDQHTDLLSARNAVAQAQTNLVLQKRMPVPDVTANTYQQYDNAAQTYQFGVQLGVSLPVHDRNQGNIRAAQAKLASAGQRVIVTQNDLLGRLAEAYGRYEANTRIVTSYRADVLPNLVRAYQAVVRRYQVEPDKVGFNDIVVAQQNLAQSLQTYLQALDAQWKAVVDLATLGQLDELFVEGCGLPGPVTPKSP